MRTLCYSVRLVSLSKISPICYKAIAFDGSTALIPAKFVYGIDFGVTSSDAWWIAAWILEKNTLQYTTKKRAWFDEKGQMLPEVTITEKNPTKRGPVNNNIIKNLER